MAGHSKWASIKHKKAVVDARRGQQFTKLARAITVAAREGGDPQANASLAQAISKAKEASMPKENIQRAIDKGTGASGDTESLERVTYEGYGPGGVAILVEALTDNRNRTGADIRHAFSKAGGSLGEPGSVAFQFERQGLILARAGEEEGLLAVEAGAQDIEISEEGLEILTPPHQLLKVAEALKEVGVVIEVQELIQKPKAEVEVDKPTFSKLMSLIELLENHDDVENAWANLKETAD